MNARDELAEIIANFRDDWYKIDRKAPAGIDLDEAAHILAAGYRKPRTITTHGELEALPAKSAILDQTGTPWVGDGDKGGAWASVCEDPFGGPIWKNSLDIALPVTVLHEGTQP